MSTAARLAGRSRLLWASVPIAWVLLLHELFGGGAATGLIALVASYSTMFAANILDDRNRRGSGPSPPAESSESQEE
jgi:hypothetical protein